MKKRYNTLTALSYEPEADVITWELSHEPIDYAKEMGWLVVHFSKRNIPVLVEILNAKQFLQKTSTLIAKKQRVFSHV